MIKHIEIYLNEKEFERLSKIKEKYGLTWKGMLKRGNHND